MAVQVLVVDGAKHKHTSTNLQVFTGPPGPEGNAEWWPGYPDINKMYRHPAFQVQRDILGYVTGGDWVRGSTKPSYLSPAVGTVSTPDAADLNITTDVRFTCKIRDTSTESTTSRMVAAKSNSGSSILSWRFGHTYLTGWNVSSYPSGTATPQTVVNVATRSAFGLTPAGVDRHVGAILTGVGATTALTLQAQMIHSLDGVNWVNVGTPNAAIAANSMSNDSASPLIIGLAMQGRVYWAQLEGLDANGESTGIIWRFDATEYPGTGTVYTDPRGRVWTLTSATAIVRTVLPQTALRYPIGELELAEAAAERGILHVRPRDYTSLEIFWGIPGRVFTTWAEVAMVRSAFGYPETVNDGQTIFRYPQTVLFPDGMPEDFIMPPLYDEKLTAGRYYYYSLFFRVNFNWVRTTTGSALLPRNHHHAEHLWNALPPYYRWVDNQQREEDGDLQRFLRVFGFELDYTREYVENWQELYHIDFCPGPLLRRLGPTYGISFESGIGEIRYRSLLAEIGYLYGIRGTRPCLEKVCEAVSKYECGVTQTGNLMTLPDDSDFFEGTGNWAGYNTAYDIDNVLVPPPDVTVLTPDKVFLKSNKTVPPPEGYGRAVMEVWSAEADEAVDVVITCGSGVVYDVYTGKDENGVDLPYGPRYIYPIQVGILADNDGVYAFSCQIKMDTPYPIGITLLWYDTDGGAADYMAKTELLPTAPSDTNWKAYKSTGTVPPGAVYAVPAIYFTTRAAGASSGSKSPSVYIAGAAVYNLGSSKRISSEAPNPYLEMGNIMKRLGLPIAVPPAPDAGLPPLPTPYPGYQIGQKT